MKHLHVTLLAFLLCFAAGYAANFSTTARMLSDLSERTRRSFLSDMKERHGIFEGRGELLALRCSLQVTSAPVTDPTGVCLDESTVNFDDNVSIRVFGEETHQPTCRCISDSNLDLLRSMVPKPPKNATATPKEIAIFVADFNNLMGRLLGRVGYTCETGCTACFPQGYCAYLTEDEDMSYSVQTNFTFDEIKFLQRTRQ
jgi:hypothetical protein